MLIYSIYYFRWKLFIFFIASSADALPLLAGIKGTLMVCDDKTFIRREQIVFVSNDELLTLSLVLWEFAIEAFIRLSKDK